MDDPFGLNKPKRKKLQEAVLGQQAPLSMTFVDVDTSKAVILERIEDGGEPDYCVHGRTKCYSCEKWCYLGVETLKAVQAGTMPLCRQCGAQYCEPGNLLGNLDDKGNSHR